MKVKLINYTNFAAETLIVSKSTRLEKSPEINDIVSWPEEKKMAELDYILKTIQSSWEFIDYVFRIEGVSRAFTHQFVRTRTGSYAQQSQRTVNMEGFKFIIPKGIEDRKCDDTAAYPDYVTAMNEANEYYNALIENDVPPQDARGILPTNVETSILAKFNLRTLSDMAHKRLCYRTQGEYQEVFKAMRDAVIKVHPWTEKFIRVYCAATGVCQFPNFKECPIKGGIFNPETAERWDRDSKPVMDIQGNVLHKDFIKTAPLTKEQIQALWSKTNFEATPKWKGNS